MNILYYCDEYPPYKNGGIGSVVKLVAEALAAKGHSVWVVGKYWDNAGQTSTELINDVNVVRWHKDSYQSLPIKMCNLLPDSIGRKRKAQLIFNRTMSLVKEVIREHDIQLVEFPDYIDDFYFNSSLSMRKVRFTVPLVVRVHGSVSFLSFNRNGCHDEAHLRRDRAFFACADHICAVSNFSKQYVLDHISPSASVEVIYNPIEDNLFDGVKTNESSNTILFFGKIIETKGAINLIKAFNIVAAENLDIRLKLIGNGEIDKAKTLVGQHCQDRVEFCGFKAKEEVMQAIDDSLFCVLPSYFENFSMAALEVLSRKRVLIYTKLSSGPELIADGASGILVDPAKVDEIAQAMQSLLTNEDLQSQMATRGYEMCKSRFSTSVIIPQMENYYQTIINSCYGNN